MPFQPGQSGNPKGRKPKAEKFKRPIAAAEKQCADRLAHNIENLQSLADGGYQRVTEKWEPAGLLLLDLPVRDSHGDPVKDESGKVQFAKQPVFPDVPPDTMVLVQRTTEIADRDRGANIYLVDRIMDKPMQPREIAGKDGAAHPTAPISLDEWKALAEKRMAAASETMRMFDTYGEDGQTNGNLNGHNLS